jgi:hypothetical protein
MSEEEKNAIREQHAGGMKIMTESFSKLLNSKLGDAKPFVNEQESLLNPEQQKMFDYAKNKWEEGKPGSVESEQNSGTISLTNKNRSSLIFDVMKKLISYDKNNAIDPKPISMNVPFNDFKKWFDSNNNYNPFSGMVKEQMDMEDDFEGVEEVSHMSFLLQNADKNTATNLLKKYMAKHSQTVNFVAILRSEGVDLTDINFCECPNLLMVNLRETPNNFEETQGNCAYNMRGGLWDFDMSDEKPSVNVQMDESTTSKQYLSEQSVSSVNIKSNPQEWYNQFPCMKSVGVKMNGGKATFKGKVLLAEPVKYGTPDYEQSLKEKSHKKMVGQVQGGGYYFCDASYPEFIVVKS